MSIYTKSGDKGETGLFSKTPGKPIRVDKDDQIIRTIGTIDEANSYLGIIVSEINDKQLIKTLKQVQTNLFTIGSILAGSDLTFSSGETDKLEKIIDDIDKQVPPLTNFILPGGSSVAARLHFARTLVRRAEREMAALNNERKIPAVILKYINRLSDTLFMLARDENRKKGIEEEKWVREKSKKVSK